MRWSQFTIAITDADIVTNAFPISFTYSDGRCDRYCDPNSDKLVFLYEFSSVCFDGAISRFSSIHLIQFS
jgi:hypothetical protein